MVNATAVSLEDEEGVIKGPHYYLIKHCSLDELEGEVYTLLKEKRSMPLSVLWKRFNCHLWEIVAVLCRLKKKGLVEEIEPTSESYGGSR